MIFIPSIVSTALRWGFDYVHRLLYFMKSFFRAPLWGGGSIFLVVYSLREGIVWGVDFCCAVDAVRWLGIYCRHMPLCDLFSALFLFAVNKEINVADHSLISVLGLAWSLHFRPRFEDLEYCLLFLVCFWLSHDWARGCTNEFGAYAGGCISYLPCFMTEYLAFLGKQFEKWVLLPELPCVVIFPWRNSCLR